MDLLFFRFCFYHTSCQTQCPSLLHGATFHFLCLLKNWMIQLKKASPPLEIKSRHFARKFLQKIMGSSNIYFYQVFICINSFLSYVPILVFICSFFCPSPTIKTHIFFDTHFWYYYFILFLWSLSREFVLSSYHLSKFTA